MYQPPNPKTAGSRVSGVRNSELGRIWGDQYNLIYNRTYRVPSSGHPNPETRDCRVLGIGHTEFRVPSSGHPIPETRQSQVLGFGCLELGTRSEFRTPDTQDPTVSGFGVQVSGIWNSDSGFRDSALPKPGS
ncbi:hypothetical protein EV424DRAFT_1346793 [Suillus variegatus]|nr:hypothetical protein EV424DRAFT_1346793 [Suillus variegatus]